MPPARIGTISFIDEENGFVLVDAETLAGALPGEPLVCIANQSETGMLRMSSLRNPLLSWLTSSAANPERATSSTNAD